MGMTNFIYVIVILLMLFFVGFGFILMFKQKLYWDFITKFIMKHKTTELQNDMQKIINNKFAVVVLKFCGFLAILTSIYVIYIVCIGDMETLF